MRKEERELKVVEIEIGMSKMGTPVGYEFGYLATNIHRDVIVKTIRQLISDHEGNPKAALFVKSASPNCQFFRTAGIPIEINDLVINVEIEKRGNKYISNVVIHEIESINEKYCYATLRKIWNSDDSDVPPEWEELVSSAITLSSNAEYVYSPGYYSADSRNLDKIKEIDWSKYCQDSIEQVEFNYVPIESKSDFEFETVETVSETINPEPEPEPVTTFIGSIQNFLGHMVY